MTAGEYLRSCRHLSGRPLRQVAAELGVSVSYLSDVERDRRPVPRDPALRSALCRAIEADNILVELLSARTATSIYVGDLSAMDRERVADFARLLRAR